MAAPLLSALIWSLVICRCADAYLSPLPQIMMPRLIPRRPASLTVLQQQQPPVNEPGDNWLADRETVVKAALIRDIIDHYEAASELDPFDTSPIQKELQLFTKGKLYESVMIKAQDNQRTKPRRLEKLKQIDKRILRYIKPIRSRNARMKVERIIRALQEGAGSVDLELERMMEAGAFDSNLIDYLDETIQRASGLSGNEQHDALTAAFLKNIKLRILAEVQMTGKGNERYVRTLAFGKKIDNKHQRREFMQQSIGRIEGLEEFKQFLQEAIQYNEHSDKPIFSDSEVSRIREMIADCDLINPLITKPRVDFPGMHGADNPLNEAEDRPYSFPRPAPRQAAG
ncbi:unnamed protein product [Vitrella brassicaformis CCMP3155]|uniref:Uncharacterized protein n=1 Tax=Vitrella brassicaformis (strain CCMP3155) TaxID=1169540 RepID=A0A0G4E8H0_VITBC|nr:unnamed protein product [Vitrella brassicaformis CCMP3155]|eukprot:CEL91776.1 unnamed protein product [Vitrella brassicaformis CCMP3155]